MNTAMSSTNAFKNKYLTDSYNISVHIMDINTTEPHLWNKSQKMGVWVWLLIFDHSSPTQTRAQIKSEEFIGHVKQHFMTSPLTYVTKGIQDFVKCCIKCFVHLDLQYYNMLFGRLQPLKPMKTEVSCE